MRTIIRRAVTKDIEAMALLLEQLFSIEADFIPDTEKQKSGLKLMVESANACVLVAETEEKITGMLTAQFVISSAEGGLAAWLEDLVVDQHYRGKGIGSMLMSEMKKQLAQSGISRMQLLADKMNTPALLFYQKQGWNVTQLICLRKYTSENTF